MLLCGREVLVLLFLCGGSSYVGGGGEAVEVVALGGEASGEVAGVALLCEAVADEGLAGREPVLEAVGDGIEAGLVVCDLLVEPADQGRDVGVPALLGVEFTLGPDSGFFPGGVTVPPAVASGGSLLSMLVGVAGLGEIPDGPACVGVLPDALAGGEVGAGLVGLGEGGFGLAQGGGPIGQADTSDGISGEGRLSAPKGGEASLLVSRERPEAIAGQGGGVGQGGIERPGGSMPVCPVPAQIVEGPGQVVGDGPDVGGLSGPGHGHVGEFPAAAVGVEVGPAGGGALGTVHGRGVAVVETIVACVLFADQQVLAVVGLERQRLVGQVDSGDDRPLGRDQPAVGSGGQGDDVVTGPVGAAALCGQFGSAQPATSLHPGSGPLVEGGHVGSPPGVKAGGVAGSHIGGPSVHGLLQGVVAFNGGVDPALMVVPGHSLANLPVAQLGQGATLRLVVLAAVLGQLGDRVGVAADQGSQGPAGADGAQLVGVAQPIRVCRRRPRCGR